MIEIGSRDVNGGILGLLGDAAGYVGVDLSDGPGVDVVADAATWQPTQRPDTVICLEVFEHTPEWSTICENVAGWLGPGGVFIGTAAAPGRAPHSATTTGPIPPGEYYSNVPPEGLRTVLASLFDEVTVRVDGTDVRWLCRHSI